MIQSILKGVLLFGLAYVLGVSAAVAATQGTCTPSPAVLNLNLTTNTSQQVSYTCTGFGRPGPIPYEITFNPGPQSLPATIGRGIEITGGGSSYPNYVVTVRAIKSGSYQAPVTFAAPGTAWNAVANNPVLTVNVVSSPAPPPAVLPKLTGTLSCTKSVMVNAQADCQVTLTNANATLPENIVVTPIKESGTGSLGLASSCPAGTPVQGLPCFVHFSFTPTAAISASIGGSYSYAQSKPSFSLTPVTITVNNPPPTPSKIKGTVNCQPVSIAAGGTTVCSVTFISKELIPAGETQVSDQYGFITKKICASKVTCTVFVKAPSTTTKTSDLITAIYTENAPPNTATTATQTISITPAPPPPSTGVTGQVTGGVCQENGILVGTAVNCTVTYTNNSTDTFSNLTFSGSAGVTPPGSNVCSATLGPKGTCAATYTINPYPISSLKPVVQMSILSNKTSLASVNQPLTFTPAVNETGKWDCKLKAVAPGGTTTCSVSLISINSGININALIQPTSSEGGTFSPKEYSQAISYKTESTFTFTYTAPNKPTTDSLGINYSDNYESVIGVKSVNITVGGQEITASGIRCYPDPAVAGKPVTCNMLINNKGTSPIPSITPPTYTFGAAKPAPTTSTCANVQPGASCTVTFTFSPTAPSSGTSVVINVNPAGTKHIFSEQTRILSVTPYVQANPIHCDKTYVTPGETTSCSIVFRRMGTNSLSGVSAVATATHGGTGSNSVSCPTGGASCSLMFTYTAPVTFKHNTDQISVSYSDANKGAPAFLNPLSIILLPSASSPDITGSVIAPMPANHIAYGSTPLSVTFQFMNASTTTYDFANPVVVAIANGEAKPLPVTAPSCSTLGSTQGCQFTVDFTPNVFNGYKIGDHVVLAAWLPEAGSAPKSSSIATWDFTIGDAPIFTDIYTNSLSLNAAPAFQGAFIFGNNTGSDLTNVRVPRVFLPAGITTGGLSDICPAGVKAKYSGATPATPCSQGTLLKNSYCYICFQASATSGFPSRNYFKAQLDYDNSMTEITQDFPGTVGNRTLTLVNKCAIPVQPAFTSAAAYYSCSTSADCPINSICTKKQCHDNSQSEKSCVARPDLCPNRSTCNKASGVCYWTAQTSSSLAANGGTSTVSIPNIPVTKAGIYSVVWSGGLIGKTGCDSSGNHCVTGDKPPFTQVEPTFLYQNQDYYDVEIINGFNIPISMKPSTAVSIDPNHPYFCNIAGEQLKDNANVCPWNFTMKTYNLDAGRTARYSPGFAALHTYVTDGGTTCNPSASKPDPCDFKSTKTVCGLSQTNSTVNPPTLTCGTLIGFWSSNQLCANNASLNYQNTDTKEQLNCTSAPDNIPLPNWFGCNAGSAVNSCYSSSAKGCCGCPFWTKQSQQPANFAKLFSGKFLAPANSCEGSSTTWQKNVMFPSLVWMKLGCTTAYTFPYDDATSTFACSSNNNPLNPAGPVNKQNYTVTFCPDGVQGTINNTSMSFGAQSLKKLAAHKAWYKKVA